MMKVTKKTNPNDIKFDTIYKNLEIPEIIKNQKNKKHKKYIQDLKTIKIKIVEVYTRWWLINAIKKPFVILYLFILEDKM